MILSKNSIHVLEERYLLKNKDGKIIETPEELFRRTASICKDPDRAERIFNYLCELEFLPNSPTLMNAGTDIGQFSACFVLPVEDSLESIFDAVKDMALIQQSGGGTGFNFSKIRPKGTSVKSTQGVASGPISFMEVFDSATNTIKQGGKRRGANMGLLNVDHPDILNFITCKDQGDKLSNFNISVAVTDTFMNAVISDSLWQLKFNDKIYETLSARTIFNKIIEHAHTNADPGLLFLDTINVNNKGEYMDSTNPCGEQPLLPYESCNLASINLSKLVLDDTGFSSADPIDRIDFIKLSQIIYDLVPFMNDIIDENKYVSAIPQIKEKTLKTRKIGIGVMGWADMLIKLNIPYNSPEALKLGEQIMKEINTKCHEISEYNNQNMTTIAPTGTISVIANCSSGIEPIFAVAYKRNLKETIGKDLYEINSHFMELAKAQNFYSNTLIEKILANKGSVRGISEVSEAIQRIFLTAYDINYEDHIKMQAAFQKHVDSAISKTINMLSTVTIQEVYNAYMLAWKLRCKGITIYRDGSKDNQVLTTSALSSISEPIKTPRERYKYHLGIIGQLDTGCGTMFDAISYDTHSLLETFIINGGNGGCASSQELEGRLISETLRYNIPVEVTIKQFKRTRKCASAHPIIRNGEVIRERKLSCAEAITNTITDFYGTDIEQKMIALQKEIHQRFNITNQPFDNLSSDENTVTNTFQATEKNTKCPNCGSTNIENTKCTTCIECGYSKCFS